MMVFEKKKELAIANYCAIKSLDNRYNDFLHKHSNIEDLVLIHLCGLNCKVKITCSGAAVIICLMLLKDIPLFSGFN